MKNKIPTFQLIPVYQAIMVLWCVLSTLAMVVLNPQIGLVAASIIILIAVFSLLRLFPLSSWIAALLGSGLYYAVYSNLFAGDQNMLITVGTAALIYFITALLSNLYNHQMDILNEQVRKEEDLLKDLIQYDQSTGIFRWKFARQKLTTEVLRSRRYKKNLSLVLIQPLLPDQSEMSEKELHNINGQVVEIILNGIRNEVDIPFIGEKLGIILPETGTEGAQILSGRLVDNTFRKIRLDLAIGIASIPNDAVSDDILLNDAEMALNFAITSGQSVVPFSRLREATDNSKEPEPIVLTQADAQADQVEPPPAVILPEKPLIKELVPDNEWKLELYNFTAVNTLPRLEWNIMNCGSFSEFHFLGMTGSILVVKVHSLTQNPLPVIQTLGLDIADIQQTDHVIQITLNSNPSNQASFENTKILNPDYTKN